MIHLFGCGAQFFRGELWASEVAGAGLDDGARREALGRKLRERDLGEVVESIIAVLGGGPDVGVRAVGIAV